MPRLSLRLISEILILFVGVPTIILVYRLAPMLMLFLWLGTLVCIAILPKDAIPRLKDLWHHESHTVNNIIWIILRWVVASILLFYFTTILFPERLFELTERPQLLVMITFFYPILSALPQEFIFCVFFFQRYERLFHNTSVMILMSAICFSYAHLLFINWVAPSLSFIAGLIFARTYARTRSLSLVTFEHALYGLSVFYIGLGWYFYGGAVQQ